MASPFVPGFTPAPLPLPSPAHAPSPLTALLAQGGGLAFPLRAAVPVPADISQRPNEVLGGVESALSLCSRAETLLGEMKALEGRIFESESRNEDVDMGIGGGGGSGARLQALQQEYHSTLQALLQLSTSNLFGAIPLPLSSASPTFTSNHDTSAGPTLTPNPDPNTGGNGSTATPDIASLTQWAETRAALEFGRRQGVQDASKAIVEILQRTG